MKLQRIESEEDKDIVNYIDSYRILGENIKINVTMSYIRSWDKEGWRDTIEINIPLLEFIVLTSKI